MVYSPNLEQLSRQFMVLWCKIGVFSQTKAKKYSKFNGLSNQVRGECDNLITFARAHLMNLLIWRR